MQGTNQLIADAVVNMQSSLLEEVRDSVKKASRKAYDDGFEDGRKNDYNNRWTEKEEVFDMSELEHS